MTKITIPDTADLLARLSRGVRRMDQKPADNNAAEAALRKEALAGIRALEAEVSFRATRIEALERALDEIIMEATSRNHAIDIARRARAEGGE